MSRIVVLGSGAWGTAIALSLHRRGGHQITLWSHSLEEARQIAEAGENTLFLPGFPLPAEIAVTGETTAVAEAEIVVSVIPSEFSAPHLYAACAPTCTQARSLSAPPRASRTTPICA